LTESIIPNAISQFHSQTLRGNFILIFFPLSFSIFVPDKNGVYILKK
jgi:hypothetical protein